MITKEQAVELVRSDLEEEMDIMLDSIIENDYGWLIFCQSKEYIETGNTEDMAVGSGGTLIEKKSGRKVQFGSAYSTEQNLEIYEKGYLKYENWDIVITKVNDLKRTIEYIDKLGISYVVPEEAHGEVWKIPKQYTYEQFESKLETLPVRFNLGSVYFQYQHLESFKKQKDFIYQLECNQGFKNCI